MTQFKNSVISFLCSQISRDFLQDERKDKVEIGKKSDLLKRKLILKDQSMIAQFSSIILKHSTLTAHIQNARRLAGHRID
jgi:hypothetical protein